MGVVADGLVLGPDSGRVGDDPTLTAGHDPLEVCGHLDPAADRGRCTE